MPLATSREWQRQVRLIVEMWVVYLNKGKLKGDQAERLEHLRAEIRRTDESLPSSGKKRRHDDHL